MARMRRKSDLPVKACVHCGLDFAWRKKWERDWEQVKFCSERCRRTHRAKGADSAGASAGDGAGA